MTQNRIMPGGAVRGALPATLAALTLIFALGGCGSGGSTTSAGTADKAADAVILNEILARQSGAVEAHDRSLRGLSGEDLELARLFRVQEEEHVDGTLKSLRGLGDAPAEAAPEEIEMGKLKLKDEYLEFLYELESATIEAETSAIAKLTEAAPRTLLAATVANQAQHLVLLRRALGAKPKEAVPSPYENGTTPAP